MCDGDTSKLLDSDTFPHIYAWKHNNTEINKYNRKENTCKVY